MNTKGFVASDGLEVLVTDGIDQRATTCSEQVNKKERRNKFEKTFILKVCMCGRTSSRQKSGSEGSSAWLYWSLCRKSHSNNLKNASCAVLASQQINSCVPVWLETGCLRKLPMRRGLNCNSCVGEGAARRAAPPCITPHPSSISSAPPLLWCKPALGASRDTWASVPQRKKGRRRRRWLRGQEAPGPVVRRFLLLFCVKGDLKGSDPPRYIPKTYDLHTTFTAIASTEQMLEKLLGTETLGISSLPLVGVEMEAYFFAPELWKHSAGLWWVDGFWCIGSKGVSLLRKTGTVHCLSLWRASGLWSSNFVFWKEEKQLRLFK